MNVHARIYNDEDAARRHLETLQWPDGPICPHCGVLNEATKLKGKSTRKGVYWCNACQRPFSVTVGTAFERSHIPLTKWLLASDLITSSKKGITARQLQRTLGITYKTALSMMQRIREGMGDADDLQPVGTQTVGVREARGANSSASATGYKKGAAAPKVRRSRAERRAAAIRQILDVAEELFSENGYSGVTIKDVANKVGVHSALVLYYFDGKQGLFDAVCSRRVNDAVIARTKALEEYEAQAGDHPTVEGALRAFYDGAFDAYIEGGEGWRNFGRIFAQVNNAPGYGAEKMQKYFDPMVLRLIGILQKAAPGADPEDIFWGFQFTSGAYTQALARTGRIDRLSQGLCSSDDLNAVRERLSVFMAAGFEALRARKRPSDGSNEPRKRRKTRRR